VGIVIVVDSSCVRRLEVTIRAQLSLTQEVRVYQMIVFVFSNVRTFVSAVTLETGVESMDDIENCCISESWLNVPEDKAG